MTTGKEGPNKTAAMDRGERWFMMSSPVARCVHMLVARRFPWKQGRLLLTISLTMGLLMTRSALPVRASSSQVADCTFATLQTDLQAGGDWYYAPGQCAGNTTANTIPVTGTITIGKDASVTSQGADIVLDGARSVQLFVVNSGVSFGLTKLTLNNAHDPSSRNVDGSVNVNSNGGAIHNNGTLTVTNSTFTGNESYSNGAAIYDAPGATLSVSGSSFTSNPTTGGNSAGGDGGGVYNSTGGTATIANSTFGWNDAQGKGGALFNGGTMTITNSTLGNVGTGNTAHQSGGAISNYGSQLTITKSFLGGNQAYGTGGALDNGGPASITNSTIFRNWAFSGGAISTGSTLTVIDSTITGNTVDNIGGGILNGGTVTLGGTILSGNGCAPTSGGNCTQSGYYVNCELQNTTATYGDLGYNMVPGGVCLHNAIGDNTGSDPGFVSGSNNGGPTPTIALSSTSAAIDQIPIGNALCPATDQRGFTRPAGAGCDIGAFEYHAAQPLVCPTFDSLQAAVADAYSPVLLLTCNSPDDIQFKSTLNIGTSTVPQTITLDASASSAPITLDGQGKVRQFVVNSSSALGLKSLTLSHGKATYDASTAGSGDGGAIRTDGTVTITNSTLSENSAGGNGGAISNGKTLTITNSTLSHNTAYYNGGAIRSPGTTTITNSTLVGNSAGVGNPAGGNGGALKTGGQTGASITVGGTIIASSSGGNCAGTVTDSGYNLEWTGSTTSTDYTCGFSAAKNDITGNDPLLGTLSSNGGPTQTIALGTGSPAINVIPAASCPSTDQRGVTRLSSGDTACDIGAYDTTTATQTTPLTQTTLTVNAPTSGTYGQVFTLTSSGGSGTGAVTYDVGTSTACSVSGTQLTITSGTGTCTVTASKAGDTNYTSTASAPATVTVNTAGQSITFTSIANKTYGDADFDPGATASSGLPVGYSVGSTDNCTIVSGLVHLTGAGTCTVTASQAGNGNYTAATSASQTFTIAKATATITIDPTSLTQTYNGSARTVTATTSPSSLAYSVTYAGSGTTTYASSTTAPTNAGTYSVKATITDPNYSGSDIQTLTVNKADQSITFGALSAKAYGASSFSVSATASSGLAVSFAASGPCTVAQDATTGAWSISVTGAGTGTSGCTITASQGGNTNYNAATSVSQSFDIAKKSLTITPTHAAISYGDTAPTSGWGYTASGFVNGDTAGTITGNPSGCSTTYVQGNAAGTSYTITCTDTSGMSAANYTFTLATGSLTLVTRAIEVTASPVGYTYGSTPPTSYGATVTAGSLVGTDSLSGLGVTCSPVNSSNTAFTPTATTAAGQYRITCSGGNTTDYSYTYKPGTLTVSPRPITVTASSPATQTYGATSNPTVSCTGSGFLSGDTFASSPVGGVYDATGAKSVTIGTTSNAGSYTTNCSGGTVGSNYTIQSYVPGTFTISAASLTVTASGGSMTYGGTVPTITAQYAGFANGDTAASLTTAPTCSTVASSGSAVGQYASSCSGAAGSNYTISYVAGSVTVSPTPLSITAPSPGMTYGDTTLPSLTPSSVTGLKNGDTFSSLGGSCSPLTSSGTTFTLSSGTNAGIYTVRCSGVTSTNYTVTYTDGTLTVNRAPLTITASSGSMTYDATVPAITPSYASFVNGDLATSLSTAPTCGTVATSSSGVGQYTSTCSGAVSGNYTISYVAGTVQVTPATLIVTAPNASVQYSDALPALSPTITGYAPGQGPSALTTAPTCTSTVLTGAFTNAAGITTTTTGVTSPAGTYSITCSGGQAANYTFSYTPGTLTVNQEDARVQTSASPSAQVLSSGPITLSATVRDSAASGYSGANPESSTSGTVGDVTKTLVEFDVYNAATCLSGTPAMSPVVSVSSSTRGVGTASYALPSPTTEASYCVVPRIVGGPATTGNGYGINSLNPYYTAPAGSGTGIAFYTNTGQFATGGGWIADSSSTTGQGALSFNARYTKTGGAKGQMAYSWQGMYQGQLATFTITSNAISTLTFSGTTSPITATLQGKCAESIVSVATGQVLSSPGNLTFTATAKDGDYGLSQNIPSDAFSLSVFNSSNQPVKQVTATPLGDGNLVVHNS